MTTMNVTQTGLEVWVENTPAVKITQVGIEIWVQNPAAAEITQVGIEVWRTITDGSTIMVVTQTGIEVWESIPFVPPVSTKRVIIVIMGGG